MTANGFDAMAQYARLSERVENQGKDIVDMRSNMNSGFQAVNSSITALASELRGNSRTPWAIIWSAIGVSFGIIAMLGSQQLSPIKDDIADLKSGMMSFSERMVTQAEMQWRTQRGVEDRQRVETAVANLRDEQVPRKEMERVWDAERARNDDLQRQITAIAENSASTITPRDALQSLNERLDRLERMKAGVNP